MRLYMKVKNDHRSKVSNLSNWKEEAWKNQGFNGIRTCDLSLLTGNVICDGWVTKERISQKLLFWWHDWEVLVFSRESFEYLMF